jgi:hypothetical protein
MNNKSPFTYDVNASALPKHYSYAIQCLKEKAREVREEIFDMLDKHYKKYTRNNQKALENKTEDQIRELFPSNLFFDDEKVDRNNEVELFTEIYKFCYNYRSDKAPAWAEDMPYDITMKVAEYSDLWDACVAESKTHTILKSVSHLIAVNS